MMVLICPPPTMELLFHQNHLVYTYAMNPNVYSGSYYFITDFDLSALRSATANLKKRLEVWNPTIS